MKKQLLSSVLLFMIAAAAGGLISGCPVGGGCRYKDYEGVITIEDIRRQSDETSAPESPDEKLFIFYKFKADADAPPPVGNFSGETQLTRQAIDQKEIKINRQFRAKAKYIERGTCNPGPYLEEFEKWR